MESRLAQDAYVFAYPLLVAGRAVDRVNRLFVAPGAPGTFRICGWLDLGREPIVVALPETRGRYHVLWLRDAWNTMFASVGTRTTGCRAHAFAVLGPGRHGERIQAALGRIAAPTRLVRVTGCIAAADAADARSLGLRTGSLSRWSDLTDGTPATVLAAPPRAEADPVAAVRTTASSAAESGRRRIEATPAPMPTATAGCARADRDSDAANERLSPPPPALPRRPSWPFLDPPPRRSPRAAPGLVLFSRSASDPPRPRAFLPFLFFEPDCLPAMSVTPSRLQPSAPR